MTSERVAFIGLDTSKLKISVAVAAGERNGEVRFLGDISSEPAGLPPTRARPCWTHNGLHSPNPFTLDQLHKMPRLNA